MTPPYSAPGPEKRSGSGLSADLRKFAHDLAVSAGRQGVVTAVLVVLGALLEGLSLVLLVPLLGVVIGSGPPSGRFAAALASLPAFHTGSPLGQLTLLLTIFAFLMVLRSAVLAKRDAAMARLQFGFVEAQRMRIVEALASAPWEQIVRLRHARVTQLMSGDINRIGAAASLFLRCAVALVMILMQCALIVLLAPLLAVFAFGFLALAAVAFLPIVRRAGIFGAQVAGANLALLDSTTRFLGGLKLAVSQNLQARFVGEFRRDLEDLSALSIDFTRRQTNRREIFTLFTAIAGGLLVFAGFGFFAVPPATLIALLLIVARTSGPLSQIQQSVVQLAQMLPVYAQVNAVVSELAALPQPRPVAVAPPQDGPIVFENVTFRYPGGEGETRGVRGIDLTLSPGEWVGITGASGAGKTTLADLLAGLFPPDAGRILVGGRPLEGAALTAWRDRISYVAQDPFLFHDTIRRNLVWAVAAKPNDEADIWDALAAAGVDTVVRNMAKGLDTVAGERGTLMSGGERQRIALARAILRKPSLLVLDEATGAIDIPAERAILTRLRARDPKTTVVIIAHRAESLALCDRVLRMEDGRLAGAAGG